MPTPAEPITIKMSNGDVYTGTCSSAVRAEAILAAGQATGALVFVYTPSGGTAAETVYLANRHIVSVK